jgi:hypothetical protein
MGGRARRQTMNGYCTFFDRGYLPQGLALWHSIRRHEPEATGWMLALDEETADGLRGVAAPGIRVVALAQLLAADPQLAAVQMGRSRAEFAFTLKPCLCRYLLRENPGIAVLTYLDSDLYFFSDPAAIHRELGERSVLLVPHRYPSWHDDRAHYGTFNAGVLAFRADAPGRACVDRWREQCLASCALVPGGVSYGDQKYLDEWPDRLGAAACVSRNPGLNLAPWNWARHDCVPGSSGVTVDGEPLVAFHFAQFRRVSARWFDSGQLEYGVMPLRLRSRLYGEYWSALAAAVAAIRAVLPEYVLPRRGWKASLGPWHLALLRLFWGQFWFHGGSWWIAGRLGLGRFSGHFMGAYRRRRRT